jgi:hypothetical protein
MKTIKLRMPLFGAAGILDYLTKDPLHMQGGLRSLQGSYEFHPKRTKYKGWMRDKKR